MKNLKLIIYVEPINPDTSCPQCGSFNTVSYGNYDRFVRDLNNYDNRVGIRIMSSGHKCKDCNYYFVENYESIESQRRIAKRLNEKIKTDALTRKFTSIANDYGLTVPTVKSIFMDYVKEDSKRILCAPRVLGIDEAHIKSSSCATFVDVENSQLLEIIVGNKKSDVVKVLGSFKNSENIEVVTMDMWRGTYAYNSKQQNISIAYGNGQTVFYEYDTDDNLKYQKYQAAPNDTIEIQFKYSYNSDGELYYKADFLTNIVEVYSDDTVTLRHFTYQNEQIVIGSELANYSVVNDSQNNTTSLIVEAEDNTYLSSTYTENSIVYNNGTSEFEYISNTDTDVNEISVYNNTLDSSIFDCVYNYNNKGQIESYTFSSANEEFTYGYTYDEFGNITSYGKLVDNEFVPSETNYYYYDQSNHNDLVEHLYNNNGCDVQEDYTYDSRGNITSSAYNETYGADSYGYLTNFSYENGWNDKLSSFTTTNLNTANTYTKYLQYDAIGNITKMSESPNSDVNAQKYTWTNGRQLKSYKWYNESGNVSSEYTYTYNDNGIRTSQKSGNSPIVYKMLMGDIVLAEYTLDQNMNITVTKQYLYNANQELVGHIANGKTYFYLKNAQGDIQAVINEEGLCVLIYVHNVWGADIDIITPDISNYTNNVNSARIGAYASNTYRGYECADITDGYYLQSRYYDTYLHRFLNADIPQIAQQNKNALHGMNLFAYCANNPVMFSDPTGYELSWETIFDIIGALFIYDEISINMINIFGQNFTEGFFDFLSGMFSLLPDLPRIFHDFVKSIPQEVWDFFEEGFDKVKGELSIDHIIESLLVAFLNAIPTAASGIAFGESIAIWGVSVFPLQLALLAVGVITDDDLSPGQKLTVFILDAISTVFSNIISKLATFLDIAAPVGLIIQVGTLILPFITDFISRYRLKRTNYA